MNFRFCFSHFLGDVDVCVCDGLYLFVYLRFAYGSYKCMCRLGYDSVLMCMVMICVLGFV